ncbi:MAG: PIG-L deacetylase family protein [Alkalispirochaeta sp.]
MPDGTIREGGVVSALPEAKAGERWLFISPHDDDPAISAGMFIAAAAAEGVRVRLRIATDGSMGYTPAVRAEDVVAERRRETLASCRLLGIEDVGWYNYPDARLHLWQGRAPVSPERDGVGHPVASHSVASHTVAGHTGLQNSITAEIRSYQPNRILVMSGQDFHPDHKIVYQEVMISVFHAQGDVWPELGPPLDQLPWVYEFAAYAPFAADPDVELTGDDELFQRKLEAIATFASQTQIAHLVNDLKESGPYEYIRSFPFETYSPKRYAHLFRPEPQTERHTEPETE